MKIILWDSWNCAENVKAILWLRFGFRCCIVLDKESQATEKRGKIMVVEFIISNTVTLDEEDASEIENGTMSLSNLDWSYYLDQCGTQELIEVREA